MAHVCFVERTDDHLSSYAAVREDVAIEIVGILQKAIAAGQTEIEFERAMFHRLTRLVCEFRAHGYGNLARGLEPPIPDADYFRLREECDGASESLAEAYASNPYFHQ